MPVVKLTLEKMSSLLGRRITIGQLEEAIPWIGVEIEEKGEDWIKIEYNPNRPDFSSQVGIARALKGLQEIEIGLPKYDVTKGTVSLIVEQSVKKELIYPYERRADDIKKFLTSEACIQRAEIIPISSQFGITADDPRIEALVVSEETAPVVKSINQERSKKGLKPLRPVIVKMVLGRNGKPIKSTALREIEATKQKRSNH